MTTLTKQGYLIPITNENTEIINNIKKELLVEPFIPIPFYKKKGENLKFPVYQEYEGYISVPKFYGIQNFGLPSINKEKSGEPIDIKFNGELRPKQQQIIDKIIPHLDEKNGGVLCLPCAAGKTVLSLYLTTHYKVKTLVIVHKTFLLNQWKERAEEFTNAKIGTIQQDIIDVDGKDIVIGMLQSIAKEKYDPRIFKQFGMVIFDEAHHAPSRYFSKALPLIACKLTVGLSATPKRTDKLEKVLYWYFGDIMYKSNVEENNKVLVNIFNYDLDHDKFREYLMYTGDINRAKTINKLTSIGRRNKFIIDTIEDVLNEPKRKILVLSDRIEHLDKLKDRLDARNITTTNYYIGGMKQKDLKIAEKAQVIFASYSMASEALDIPDLNTLFMATSRKEVEQAVGRVVRKIDPNVRPIIYDLTDQLNSFVNQGHVRRRFYKKMGFEINIIEVKDNEIINSNEISDINSISDININDNNNNNIEFDFI